MNLTRMERVFKVFRGNHNGLHKNIWHEFYREKSDLRRIKRKVSAHARKQPVAIPDYNAAFNLCQSFYGVAWSDIVFCMNEYAISVIFYGNTMAINPLYLSAAVFFRVIWIAVIAQSCPFDPFLCLWRLLLHFFVEAGGGYACDGITAYLRLGHGFLSVSKIHVPQCPEYTVKFHRP